MPNFRDLSACTNSKTTWAWLSSTQSRLHPNSWKKKRCRKRHELQLSGPLPLTSDLGLKFTFRINVVATLQSSKGLCRSNLSLNPSQSKTSKRRLSVLLSTVTFFRTLMRQPRQQPIKKKMAFSCLLPRFLTIKRITWWKAAFHYRSNLFQMTGVELVGLPFQTLRTQMRSRNHLDGTLPCGRQEGLRCRDLGSEAT